MPSSGGVDSTIGIRRGGSAQLTTPEIWNLQFQISPLQRRGIFSYFIIIYFSNWISLRLWKSKLHYEKSFYKISVFRIRLSNFIINYTIFFFCWKCSWNIWCQWNDKLWRYWYWWNFEKPYIQLICIHFYISNISSKLFYNFYYSKIYRFHLFINAFHYIYCKRLFA